MKHMSMIALLPPMMGSLTLGAMTAQAGTWSDLPHEDQGGDPAVFALIVFAISIPAYVSKAFKKSKTEGMKALGIVLAICIAEIVFPGIAYFLLSLMALVFIFFIFQDLFTQ